MIRVPEKCMVCGAAWRGGSAVPGQPLTLKSRGGLALYDCGGKMWLANAYQKPGVYFVTVRCDNAPFIDVGTPGPICQKCSGKGKLRLHLSQEESKIITCSECRGTGTAPKVRPRRSKQCGRQ